MQFTCTTRKIMNPCKSFSASFFMQKERLINSECACKNLLPFLRSLELSPAWLYCQRKKKAVATLVAGIRAHRGLFLIPLFRFVFCLFLYTFRSIPIVISFTFSVPFFYRYKVGFCNDRKKNLDCYFVPSIVEQKSPFCRLILSV